MSRYIVTTIATSGRNWVAGTRWNSVFRSTDNGVTWAAAANGLPDQIKVTHVMFAGDYVLVATEADGIFRSSNMGDTWVGCDNGLSSLYTGDIRWVDGVLYAACGGVAISHDMGGTWTYPSASDPHGVTSLCEGTEGIYAGTTSGVYLTPDGGQTWTLRSEGLTDPDVVSVAASGHDLYAVTEGDEVFHSPDGGLTWQPVNSGLPCLNLNKVTMTGAMAFLGTEAGMFRMRTGDELWEPCNTGLIATGIEALAYVGSRLLAGSDNVYGSLDGGQSWEIQLEGCQFLIGFTDFAVSGEVALAGGWSGIQKSDNAGTTWELFNGGVENLPTWQIIDLEILGSFAFLGTYSMGVYRTSLEDAQWVQVNSGLSTLHVSAFASIGNTLFAATDGGGLFKTTDFGETWNHVEIAASTRWLHDAETNGTVLYVLDDLHGLYISHDEGLTWSTARPLPSELTYCFVLVEDDLLIGEDGVYVSHDQGLTWLPFADGLKDRFVLSATQAGDDLYIGTTGGVFVYEEYTTGVTAMEAAFAEIGVWPNPAMDRVTLSISFVQASVPYTITDMRGRLMTGGSITGPLAEIDIHEWPAGLYVLRCSDGRATRVARFVKQ